MSKKFPTIKKTQRAVFGPHAKGFSLKSTKQPGIDQPNPKPASTRISVASGKRKGLLY